MPARSGSSAARARRIEIERDEGADLLFARGNGFGAKLDAARRLEFAGLDAAGKIERGEHQLASNVVRTITAKINFVLLGMIRPPPRIVAMWPEVAPGSRGHG